MKKTTYIKTAILSLMGGLVLLSSSCLKDNSHYINYLADAPLAEFPLAEVNGIQPGGSDGAYQPILDTVSTFTLTVAVKVAAPKALKSATVFTISTTDLTALNNYNTANNLTTDAGTALIPLPASAFTIVGGNKVTVPAGATTTYFTIKITSSALSANGTSALPLSIADAGGVQIALPEKYLLYNFFTGD